VQSFHSQLIDNFVAVRPQEAKRSKILKPDWQQVLTGVVIAIGPGKRAEKGDATEPMECAVDDIVQFGAAIGMESQYDGIGIRVMRDSDVDLVLGRVEEGL
jgi:co-chaperonin GroES (HSP10)